MGETLTPIPAEAADAAARRVRLLENLQTAGADPSFIAAALSHADHRSMGEALAYEGTLFDEIAQVSFKPVGWNSFKPASCP